MKLATTMPTVLVALLTGCSNGDPTTSSQLPDGPKAATVRATPQIAFDPSTITVAVNQELSWEFDSVPHNVLFADLQGRPADIPGFNMNVTVTRIFHSEGTFPYECGIHPGMSGTVVVQGDSSRSSVRYAMAPLPGPEPEASNDR